jgi:heptosyltransferase-2
MPRKQPDPESPVFLIPYMWIGDFVRCHTVVRVLKERWPHRPVDVLTSHLTAPLLDYMPGVRKGIVWDLPRAALALGRHRQLAQLLRDDAELNAAGLGIWLDRPARRRPTAA